MLRSGSKRPLRTKTKNQRNKHITGMDHALFQPIRSSLPPALVPREDLPAAIAFGGFTWNSARVIGPAIGATILNFWGVNAVFLINTIL